MRRALAALLAASTFALAHAAEDPPAAKGPPSAPQSGTADAKEKAAAKDGAGRKRGDRPLLAPAVPDDGKAQQKPCVEAKPCAIE
jgi:hypothetical protein